MDHCLLPTAAAAALVTAGIHICCPVVRIQWDTDLALTFEDEHTDSAGVPAQGGHSQHEGAVLLGLAQLQAALVQQHHGLVLSGEQPAPGVLVGDDVLQAQASPGPAADYGAEAHIGGAGDMGRVEGEEGATVQQQAARGRVLQLDTQGRTVDGGHLHYDHSRTVGEEE